MASKNTTNEYLQTLNRMRSNYQSTGNVLVNPSDDSTKVGTDISTFAYMNTPLPQINTKMPKPSKDEKNITFGATTLEMENQISGAVLNTIDGIIDLVIGSAGAVSKIFGSSGDWAKDIMEYDWVSNVLTTNTISSNRDLFNSAKGQEFLRTRDPELGKQLLSEYYAKSASSLLGEQGQQTYQQILQGIGSALPSVALGGLSAGGQISTRTARALSLGTMGASSFGSGMEEAFSEGATYGQAFGSGAISTAIELGSEAIPIPGLNNRIGNIGTSIGKKTVKAIGKAMLEEGAEEVIAEFLSPLAKLPYKDIQEIEAAKGKDLLMSFVGGAIGGALGGGVSQKALRTRFSDTGLQDIELAMETSQLQQKALKEFQKGNIEQVNKLNEQIKKNVAKLQEDFKLLQESDSKNGTKYYDEVIKMLKNPTQFINTLKKKGLSAEEQEIALKEYLKDDKAIIEQLGRDTEQIVSNQIRDTLDKVSMGRNVRIEVIENEVYDNEVGNRGSLGYFFARGTNQTGYTENVIRIRRSALPHFYSKVVHEGISHGILDTNSQVRNELIDYIKKDKSLSKKWNEISKSLEGVYSKEKLESETLAKLLEDFIYNEDLLQRTVDIKTRKGLSKIMNSLKDYLKILPQDKLKTRLINQVNKAIKKINETTTKPTTTTTTETTTESERQYSRTSKPFKIIQLSKDGTSYLLEVNANKLDDLTMIHKDENTGIWHISDIQTGALINTGKTRKEAIEKYNNQYKQRLIDFKKTDDYKKVLDLYNKLTNQTTTETTEQIIQEAVENNVVEEVVEEQPSTSTEKPKKPRTQLRIVFPKGVGSEQQQRETEFTRVRLVKDHARLFADSFLSYTSSQEITKVIYDDIKSIMKKHNAKMFLNENARTIDLFEGYNLYANKDKVPVEKLRQFVNNLFDSVVKQTIKNDDGETITLEYTFREFIKSTLDSSYTIEQYEEDFVNNLLEIVNSKTDESRIKATMDFYKNRIEALKVKIYKYQHMQVYIIKTMKRISKLQTQVGKIGLSKIIESNPKIKAVLDLYNKLLGKINLSHTSKGFSPKGVEKILNVFSKFDLNILNDSDVVSLLNTTDKEFFEKNLNILKEHASFEDGVYKFKDGYWLTFNETLALHNVIGAIDKDFQSLLNQERQKYIEETLSSRHEILNVYNMRMTFPNRNVTIANNIAMNFASIDTNIGAYFGYNSDFYKIFYTDIFNAYNNKLIKSNYYVDRLEQIKKKYNVTTKDLNKKVKYKIGNRTIDTTIGWLLDVYIESCSDNGMLNLSDGGYRFISDKGQIDDVTFTDSDILNIVELLDENVINFGNEVLNDLYNKELRDYKAKKDIEIVGFERVIGNVYYPKNKVTEEDLGLDQLNIVSMDTSRGENIQETRNMTWLKIRGMSFENRYRAYVDGITNYGEMYNETKALQNILNGYIKKDDGKSVKILDMLNEAIPDISKYFMMYEQMITGQSNEKIRSRADKMMSNLVASTLFGNVSVILKQTASIPTILNEVSISSFVKSINWVKKIGKYSDIKLMLAEKSGLLKERWKKWDTVGAQTLSNNLNNIAKVFGVGMERMDEFGIITFGFMAAQYEAQTLGYGEVGSDSNINEAINILNRIVINTQSNAVPFKMSPARRGTSLWKPGLSKLVSYFKADFNNKFNYIVKVTKGWKYANKRIEFTQQEIERLETQLETITEENDLIEIEQRIKNLQKALDGDRKMVQNMPREAMKLLVSLFLSAVMIAGIEQFVSRLLRKRGWGWDEESTQDLVTTTLIDTTIGNLPFVSDILNALEFDKELTSFEFSGLNTIVDLLKNIANIYQDGELNYSGLAMNLLKVIGYGTGLPLKNLYDLIMAGFKLASPNAFTIDNIIKGYSENYIFNQFKEDIESGFKNRAKGDYKLLLSVYKGGDVSNETFDEMYRLAKNGFIVNPTSNLSQYTNEKGEVVYLTNAQRKEFLSVYNQATEKIDSMIEQMEYKNLSDEQKSKAIKKIYTTYYNVAKSKTLGTTSNDKLTNLLLEAGNNLDIVKYILSLQKITNVESTENATKKELVMKELNKLKLSKNEKLLVLYLKGYNLNDSNKINLQTFLNSKGIKSLAL